MHEREALAVPDEMSWEDASAVPEAFLTAYDALFRQLDVQMGDRLLIHAVGSGLGTAAAQLAHRMGATVSCSVVRAPSVPICMPWWAHWMRASAASR